MKPPKKKTPPRNNRQLVSISQAADLLGVCQETLRQWDREGKLIPVKTAGNHRRYRIEDISRMRGEISKQQDYSGPERVAVYCRTSSHEQKQKGDLERQLGRVLAYCIEQKYSVVEKYEEVSSGMNDVRPKLKQLFRLVEEHKIDKVVVEHKDRLCRFMFEFLTAYFKSHGVEIEWMNEVLGKSYEEELVEDMLALMSSFSNRIYGKRSAENRKARKLAKMAEKLKKDETQNHV
jgi:excisionase family DNA binding protein